MRPTKNSFDVLRSFDFDGKPVHYFSLRALEEAGIGELGRLPYSQRVLVENLLRHEDGDTVDRRAVLGLMGVGDGAPPDEIAFHPARVLMPDSSGGPLLVDLAAMRDALVARGLDPKLVNPAVPVDMVVDHSAVAEHAGSADALAKNLAIEFDLNRERYGLIRWAQQSFERFRVVPPGSGIVHQINLEYLAQVVRLDQQVGGLLAFPDTLVGMDSHTPMVNALGVLGWGVGGIEAASVMLGEPVTMRLPQVVGCRLSGSLQPGVTATDIVLTLTALLREHDVVGKFVEFYGPGLDALTVPDRATLSNMAPEYGATVGFFPVDAQTVKYLRLTGRSDEQCRLVERYARTQRLWRDEEPRFESIVSLDLNSVETTVSGPFRPQDRLTLSAVPQSFATAFQKTADGAIAATAATISTAKYGQGDQASRAVQNGDVVIAAITSCTNTSNPTVMIGAGLLARNALARGLRVKPWVKTSLSPGSRRVGEYLAAAGLDRSLNALGFQIVGYGCMTCMGSSGSLAPAIESAITQQSLSVAAVLSGNRNFEARVHALARANYLASPPLVVAYAIAGTVLRDLTREPLGTDAQGVPVYLRDIWPSDEEIAKVASATIGPSLFRLGYAHVESGTTAWDAIGSGAGSTYTWDPASTYIRRPPYVIVDAAEQTRPLHGARVLALLGDGVTTDHITPVGSTSQTSSVGRYLIEHGVAPADFNSLSSRRANPDVVARTTYANVRLRNEIVPDKPGEFTRHFPDGEVTSIFEASRRYREEGVPLIVIAGKNYGAGSSRDTAAKGVRLLGVRCVLAESFERIHRSNLIGMGVLPLEFTRGGTRRTLKLRGDETFDLDVDSRGLRPRTLVTLKIHRAGGVIDEARVLMRVDTPREGAWYAAGGIMPYVLGRLATA